MIWFFHGFLGQDTDWQSHRNFFESKGYKLRCPDLLEEHQSGESLENFACRFAKKIQNEDPEPILCGYSFGGRFVLHLLNSLPETRAAILVSTHFGLAEDAIQERRERMDSDLAWASLLRSLSWSDFYSRWNEQPMFNAQKGIPEPNPMSLERRLLWADAFSYASLALQRDYGRVHQSNSTPLLLMAGQRDEKFARHLTEKAVQLRCAKLEIVPGVGHRIPWGQPEVFQQSTHNFLESIPTLGKNETI